jgi:DNA-binding MurR/RpiR family transcriptional regulator
MASYGSVSEVARAAASNPSTVTRTAQNLGYQGWTEFQFALRSRFLASLSAVEVAETHGANASSPSLAALTTDRENLAHVNRTLDFGALRATAQAIADARRTYVIAAGSYAIPGKALEHNATIAGYDVRLLDADVATLSNAVARLSADDLVIAISLWRVYDSTLRSVNVAHGLGVRIISITDNESSPVAAHSDPRLIVPSEGAGFFPSLTPALALTQGIAVELASLDKARTKASIAAAEQTWEQLRIMATASRP